MSKEESLLLKGVAILTIVYYHAVALLGDEYVVTLIPHSKFVGEYLGNFGVTVFAFISAYGLDKIYNLHKTNGICFIKNRLVKLYGSYIPFFVLAFMVALAKQIICVTMGKGSLGLTIVYGNGINAVVHAMINMLGLSDLIYGGGRYTLNQTWWYMGLAILIVIVLPFVQWIYSKMSNWAFIPFVAIGILVPNSYLQYGTAILLGVALANAKDNFKIREVEIGNSWLTYGIAILAVVVWAIVRIFVTHEYNPLLDSAVLLPFAFLWFPIVCKAAVVKKFFLYMGKQSGNIFYVHSLIYCYWGTSKYIYMLKNSILVVAVIIVLSLVVGYVVDFIKKHVGWDRFISRLSCS